jgi:hypothetical protein
MQLATKIVEDIRDFSSVVNEYGFQPVIVPARRAALNHIIQFIDGRGRAHVVSLVVPKDGTEWSNAAIAQARLRTERIGETGYTFEEAYTRPDDIEPLRRVFPAKAGDDGMFRGRRVGIDVSEHYPRAAKYIDELENAFRRAGQEFMPVDSEEEYVITDKGVRDVLKSLEVLGREAGSYHSLSVEEASRSGRLSKVTLTRGDGLEIDAAVTTEGFVLCSLSFGDDYKEFTASSAEDFNVTIRETVEQLLPAVTISA